jgi:serine protease Do
MLRRKQLAVAAVFILIGVIVGLSLSSHFNFQTKGHSGEREVSQEAIDILSKTNEAVSEVVAVVKPSVVNISSTKTVKRGGVPAPFFNDPFFRRFFGDEFGFFGDQRRYKQSGLGSGVIVDRSGYILTNNHVIKGAEEIKVTLSDKREFKGRVIGTDQKTDLAVIKIDTDNLPVIKIGDSDMLKIGEMVLAVGNPFGLTQTVTSGIVSATGRANVGVADYEDFIQTDAPINPGNSGGALVNIRGELVGINTAIFSTTGGYQGIGFAIPSNMAKAVMESLIKKGKVVRGWLGVTIQQLTPELAKQFNLKDEAGVLIADVVEGGPAEIAGIERGDVIVEFNGKEVTDVANLRNMVADIAPNTEISVRVLHGDKAKTLRVKISEMPSETQILSKAFDNYLKGVHVQDIAPSLRKSLNIPGRITGVVITDVDDESPAAGILTRSDVIMEINRNRVANVKDFEQALSGISPDESILLLIFRKGSSLYITLPVR